MKKKILAVAVLVSLVLVGTVVEAQPNPNGLGVCRDQAWDQLRQIDHGRVAFAVDNSGRVGVSDWVKIWMEDRIRGEHGKIWMEKGPVYEGNYGSCFKYVPGLRNVPVSPPLACNYYGKCYYGWGCVAEDSVFRP